MFKKLVAALLAAATVAPAVAQEADGRDRGVSRRGEMQRVREARNEGAERPRFERGAERRQQDPVVRQQRREERRAALQPQASGFESRRDDRLAERAARWQRRQTEAQAGGFEVRRDDRLAERAARQQPRQAEVRAGGDWRGRNRGQAFAGAAPQAEWSRTDRVRRDDRRFDGGRWDDRRDRDWNDNRAWNGRRYAAPNWNGGRDWNRGWRGDNRYDWSRWRQQNRALFRLPRYYAPYDWNGGYRRFGIGATLSSLLWSQDYWIDQPWDYRLPPAYGPYQWVRYYNDALLVDVRSGYVVDTVYGIFW